MALTKPGEDILDLSTELTALSGLTSAANKVPRFTGSGTADLLDFLDEDTLLSNSATAVPSQQSVKAYADAQIATITVGRVLLVDTEISGSPSALSFEDTDGMDWSTYSSFEIELGAIISADMQINCTMSQAGVYETGGTDYTYTTSSSYTWSATGTNAAANIPIPNSSGQIYKGGAGYNEGFHMTARLSQRITDATDMQGPFLAWQMMGNITGTGNVAEQSGIGFLRNMVDSDIDGIKFTTSTGTLVDGYFKVWGIV
jgi:hypothetical protein